MGAKKGCYRVTNWKQYNESLVRRGDITLWFSEEVMLRGSMPIKG